jgi:hypothetical protein
MKIQHFSLNLKKQSIHILRNEGMQCKASWIKSYFHNNDHNWIGLGYFKQIFIQNVEPHVYSELRKRWRSVPN